jgi:hypothetical protein
MKQHLAWMLLSILGAFLAVPVDAQECSTEKVNGNCTVTIDRTYPVTTPTIQMGRKKKLTVIVVNQLAFEALSLDPQSAQAVAGTDQTAGFLNAALPNFKSFVGSLDIKGLAETKIAADVESVPSDADDVAKVKSDLKDLRGDLQTPSKRLSEFFEHATVAYLQLQEILSPLPRGFAKDTNSPVRAKEVVDANTPNPWGTNKYADWRKLMFCELSGGHCDSANATFSDILDTANVLQSALAGLNPPPPPAPAGVPLFDVAAFNAKAQVIQTEILALSVDRTPYQRELDRLKAWKSALIASATSYIAAITGISKDLGSYLVNIARTAETASNQELGEIRDPQEMSQTGACRSNLFGCQIVFSVSTVNEIATFRASVPSATQKKSIVTITVVYADPKFEVSAGAFFSTLPDRSFANQTLVTQNPGGVPTPGNVVIAQTVQRPTIVPFAAANYRLGRESLWPDGRRRAFYLTGAIGLNPYNTTAEFGFGPSMSWRSIMFSGLVHIGHDVRLTQGEFVGEVWCNQSAATGSIPKCAGNPPSPSSERYWKPAFAFGISVRVPTVFGGGSGGSSH